MHGPALRPAGRWAGRPVRQSSVKARAFAPDLR